MKRATIITLLVLGLSAAGACATLLGIQKAGPREFEHRAHALEGITCVECHSDMEEAGETGPLHIPSRAECVECHKEPHREDSCRKCHGMPSTTRHATQARKYVRFRHDEHLEEMSGKCVRCHVGVKEEGGSLRAPMSACLSCHEHKDEFEIRDCEGCHENLYEEPLVPETHIVHDSRFLENHGVQAASASELCSSCHKETFCAECHGITVAQLPSRVRFDEPMRAGMHRAGFDARHAEEARAQPGLCTTCHAENFCERCHEDRGVAATAMSARNPHPPGWVGGPGSRNLHGREARRDPTSCASCHGGAGEMLCVDCHRVGGIGGSPHPPGWDSRKSKSDVPCRLCHSPVP